MQHVFAIVINDNHWLIHLTELNALVPYVHSPVHAREPLHIISSQRPGRTAMGSMLHLIKCVLLPYE
jgi:hypothetical protein